jgi:hypothetical protein
MQKYANAFAVAAYNRKITTYRNGNRQAFYTKHSKSARVTSQLGFLFRKKPEAT